MIERTEAVALEMLPYIKGKLRYAGVCDKFSSGIATLFVAIASAASITSEQAHKMNCNTEEEDLAYRQLVSSIFNEKFISTINDIVGKIEKQSSN